jgi:hypothetical protein
MGLGRALTPFSGLADAKPGAAVWLGERHGCGSGLTRGLCAGRRSATHVREGYRDVVIRIARGEGSAKLKSKPPMARGMDGCNDKKSTTPLSLTQKR